MASKSYKKTIMALANCVAICNQLGDQTKQVETNKKLLDMVDQAGLMINGLLDRYPKQRLKEQDIKEMQKGLDLFDSPMFSNPQHGAVWPAFAILQLEELAMACKNMRIKKQFHDLINKFMEIIQYFDHNLIRDDVYSFVASEAAKYETIKN